MYTSLILSPSTSTTRFHQGILRVLQLEGSKGQQHIFSWPKAGNILNTISYLQNLFAQGCYLHLLLF